MTHEEALARFKTFGYFCDENDDDCDCDCKKCEDMERIIIEALEKQMPQKPRKTETVYGVDGCGEVTNKLVLYTCPVCDEPIHVGRGCSNNKCRQAIDWSPEKQILKNAKVLKIPKPRIVGEEGDEE